MSDTDSHDIDHDIETLTIEFDGSSIHVEVLSPQGWTTESVNPTGCSWVSEGDEHVASYYWDDVKGGTTLKIDGEVAERGISKREAATRLAEFAEGGPSSTGTEYGFNPDVGRDEADEIVRVVARIRDEQPSPEHAPVSCWDCGMSGYATPCHSIPIEDATPTTWCTVFVCRDCADRGDALCGAAPEDLSHPKVGQYDTDTDH